MFSVSITIPRNVSQVDGPSNLEVLTGTLILLHKESIACRLSEHSFVPASVCKAVVQECSEGVCSKVVVSGVYECSARGVF